MSEFRNPIGLLVLIIVVAAFSAPFGTPALAAFAKDFLPAVATLVAAYAGVWYGASLKREASTIERKSRERSIGSRSLFTIWRQLNTIAQIQEDITNKYRNVPSAPISMPPLAVPLDNKIRLDIDALGFLLDYNKSDLLVDLCIMEIRYLHALDAIRRRSALYINEIRPRLENKIPIDKMPTPDELRNIIGPLLFAQLVDLTGEVISRTDDAVGTLEVVSKDLHAAREKFSRKVSFQNRVPWMKRGKKY